MLLDLNELQVGYGLRITGVVHVGAHLAEEARTYRNLGIESVYWIEGNPDNMPAIERAISQYPSQVAINALVTDKDREPTNFNITNYDSMSSSVLEFGTHPEFSPDTVFVDHRTLESRTLDSLWAQYYYFPGVNFLNMDLQGAELMALKGAVDLLPQIDYVYSEINCKEVYLHCAQVEELDAFLEGFTRVETGWVLDQGWGDGFWIRDSK